IGVIAVVAESGVASGVRRIEAISGDTARRHLAAESRKLNDLAAALRVPASEIDVRVAQLIDDRKRLERELADARKKLAMGGGGRPDMAQAGGPDGSKADAALAAIAQALDAG